jgi:hypothetical protein
MVLLLFNPSSLGVLTYGVNSSAGKAAIAAEDGFLNPPIGCL